MKLYLIRHGRTKWNIENIFRGWKDIPLTKEGIQEAKEFSRLLFKKNFKVDHIFSSPLVRATTVAELISSEFNKPYAIDKNFIDFTFGEWEGKKKEVIAREEPELWKKWKSTPLNFKAPSGILLEEFIEKCKNYALSLKDTYFNKHIWVVTHRVVIKGLFIKIFELPQRMFWQIDVEPLSITCIDFTHNKPVLNFLNYKLI